MIEVAALSRCSEDLSKYEIMIVKLGLTSVSIERKNVQNSLFQRLFSRLYTSNVSVYGVLIHGNSLEFLGIAVECQIPNSFRQVLYCFIVGKNLG